ncbi:MAG: hypothetical protein RL154_78 [Pseudomonadota bacterium]
MIKQLAIASLLTAALMADNFTQQGSLPEPGTPMAQHASQPAAQTASTPKASSKKSSAHKSTKHKSGTKKSKSKSKSSHKKAKKANTSSQSVTH